MKALFAAAMAALFCATPASAVVRIFDFTARVDLAVPGVPAGTIVTGRFSFDDALTPTFVYEDGNTTVTEYEHPALTLTGSFAGHTFAVAGRGAVTDTPPNVSTSYVADSFTIGEYDGPIFYAVAISHPDYSWLSNTSLPSAFPSNLWQGPYLDPEETDFLTVPYGTFLSWDAANSRSVMAVILSVTPANAGAVPEPATWAMMIVGFGLIGAAVRRRGQRVAVAA